ncbi:MAG: hypothetical protein R3Y13_05575 [bacterium]
MNNKEEETINKSSNKKIDKKTNKKFLIIILILFLCSVLLLFIFYGYSNSKTSNEADSNMFQNDVEEDTLENNQNSLLKLTESIEGILTEQKTYSFTSLYINYSEDVYRESTQENWLSDNVNIINETSFAGDKSNRLYLAEVLLLNTLENPKESEESFVNITSVPSVSLISSNTFNDYYIDDYYYIFTVDIGDEDMEKCLSSLSEFHQYMNVDEANPEYQFMKSKTIENSQLYTIGNTILFMMHPLSSVIVKGLEDNFDLTNHTHMLNDSNHDGLLEEIDVFLFNEIYNWHNENIEIGLQLDDKSTFTVDPDFVLSDLSFLDETLQENLSDLVPYKDALYVSNYLSTLCVFEVEDGISVSDLADEITKKAEDDDYGGTTIIDTIGDNIIYILMYSTNDSYTSISLPEQNATLLKDFLENFKKGL